MRYRKIGGIHWVAFGRLRFSFCRTKQRETAHMHQWAVLFVGIGIYAVIWWSAFA